MRICKRLTIVVWFVLAAVPLVRAADPPAAQPGSKAAEPGPKAAEFNRIFSEWKTVLGEMRTLRGEYRQAQPARREEIEKRYGELVAQGDSILPKLIEAAETSFAEAPAESRAQGDFLLTIAANACGNDDYENAFRLTKVLIDHGYPDPQVFAWGGMAAFCTNQFDLAEKYFQEAKKAGALQLLSGDLPKLAEQWMNDIPYYKEAWRKEQALREAEAKENLPHVLLKTSKGEIEVELFENQAPNAVANFVSLVEKGFYNGTPFHRVLQQFMAQGGDPTGTGTGGPGYVIACECHQPDRRVHFRGTLSMAHAGRDTGGSQFFLTFVPTHHLDGMHTAFGRVIKGMDVLAKLQRRNPEEQDASTPDKILEAKVLQKRSHAYDPKTSPDPRR